MVLALTPDLLPFVSGQSWGVRTEDSSAEVRNYFTDGVGRAQPAALRAPTPHPPAGPSPARLLLNSTLYQQSTLGLLEVPTAGGPAPRNALLAVVRSLRKAAECSRTDLARTGAGSSIPMSAMKWQSANPINLSARSVCLRTCTSTGTGRTVSPAHAPLPGGMGKCWENSDACPSTASLGKQWGEGAADRGTARAAHREFSWLVFPPKPPAATSSRYSQGHRSHTRSHNQRALVQSDHSAGRCMQMRETTFPTWG